MRRLAAFALAGGSGFVVDAAVLYALTAFAGVGPLAARLASFATALCVTWAINRRLTFGPSGRPVVAEGARYGGVAVAVGLLNYALYAGLMMAMPGMPPLLALTFASAAAMAMSWLGYSRLVFAGPAARGAMIGRDRFS